MTPRPVALLGATPYALTLAEVINDIPGLEATALLTNRPLDETTARLARSLPVIPLAEAGPLVNSHLAIGAIGTVERGPFMATAAAMGFEFATAVHPTAWVAPSAVLGAGTRIDVRGVVAGRAELGRHVIVSRTASIGHHTCIGECSTVQPGATVCGEVAIGARVMIGAGATVRDRVRIGDDAVVGAGAVVVKDVAPGTTVLGVPAMPRQR